MTEFNVDPDALEHFATASMNRRHDVDDLRTRIQGVHVPRDSFGYIPGIGGRVHMAYDEFAHGCTDSLSSAAETLASIASAVRGVVTAYVTSDEAARDSAAVIESDPSSVDIRGMR